jgi:integrase
MFRGGEDIPLPALDRPDLPKNLAVPHWLSVEEIARALVATRTPTERACIIALAQTAVRRGELCSLTRDSIKDNAAIVTGKMDKRVLYVPSESANALEFAMLGHPWLVNTRGQRLTVGTLSKLTFEILKRAGIYKKGLGDHAFRHSYQAEYLENGGSEIFMDRIMGHKKPGDKTQLYLHADPLVLREAMRCAPRRFLQLALEMQREVAA